MGIVYRKYPMTHLSSYGHGWCNHDHTWSHDQVRTCICLYVTTPHSSFFHIHAGCQTWRSRVCQTRVMCEPGSSISSLLFTSFITQGKLITKNAHPLSLCNFRGISFGGKWYHCFQSCDWENFGRKTNGFSVWIAFCPKPCTICAKHWYLLILRIQRFCQIQV